MKENSCLFMDALASPVLHVRVNTFLMVSFPPLMIITRDLLTGRAGVGATYEQVPDCSALRTRWVLQPLVGPGQHTVHVLSFFVNNPCTKGNRIKCT